MDEELIVMPKEFDNFAKKFDTRIQQGPNSLDAALSTIFDIYMHGTREFPEMNECMRDSGADEEFYADCVHALVYGYETEQ